MPLCPPHPILANRKVSLWCGHSAELGCGYCYLRGIFQNGTRFFGYDKPVPYGPHYPEEDHGTCCAGDPVCKLNNVDQLYRAEIMEGVKGGSVKATVTSENGRERLLEGTDVGCHGMSALIAALPLLALQQCVSDPCCPCGSIWC